MRDRFSRQKNQAKEYGCDEEEFGLMCNMVLKATNAVEEAKSEVDFISAMAKKKAADTVALMTLYRVNCTERLDYLLNLLKRRGNEKPIDFFDIQNGAKTHGKEASQNALIKGAYLVDTQGRKHLPWFFTPCSDRDGIYYGKYAEEDEIYYISAQWQPFTISCVEELAFVPVWDKKNKCPDLSNAPDSWYDHTGEGKGELITAGWR